MIGKLRQAGLIWPTLLMLAGLAVLVSLGAWQWQRKAWKEGLLEKLQSAAAAAPVPLSALPAGAAGDDVRFRRVSVRGRFDHDQEFHIWAPRQQGSAWRVVTPLRLSKPLGQRRYPLSTVLIIRGFVDDAHKAPASRAGGQVGGETTVIGRVRLAARNWATPPPDMAGNQWYGLDLDGMRRAVVARYVEGSASGTVDEAMNLVAALFIEAETAAAAAPAPQPDLKQLTLRNRHLEYALTWWGLALTLVGVYAAFALGRMRRSTGRRSML